MTITLIISNDLIFLSPFYLIVNFFTASFWGYINSINAHKSMPGDEAKAVLENKRKHGWIFFTAL